MVDHSTHFLTFAVEVLQKIATESKPAIDQAAQVIANVIADDKLLFLFGSGHSALVARDGAARAGGLVPVVLIEDVIEGDAERMAGLAPIIAGRYDLNQGGAMIVISNSGINPVPIEMALLGKSKGMTVIAITSLTHSHAVESRYPDGRKLFDVADIVIDTHSVRGDAALDVAGSVYKTGATSTMAGCAIMQAITAQAAALLAERGITPPILVSANVPEGRDHNHALLDRYLHRLARFQLPVR